MKEDKALVILGSGGHCKVIIDCIVSSGLGKILFLADFDPKKQGSELFGFGIESEDEIFRRCEPESVDLVLGIGATGNLQKRKIIFEKFKTKGYSFRTIAHKNSLFSSYSDIREGGQIFAGAIVQAGAKIGENVILNTSARIDHDCRIDSHCHISPGAILCGNVFVGENTHIGAGTVIREGIRIGSNCIVGAGSVVVKDVPDGSLCYGNPAVPVGKI